jgi:hypothetical protein
MSCLRHLSALCPHPLTLAGFHLITLSALARTFGGIVKPIRLPAFRLMTNSNVFACYTGKRRGWPPSEFRCVGSIIGDNRQGTDGNETYGGFRDKICPVRATHYREADYVYGVRNNRYLRKQSWTPVRGEAKCPQIAQSRGTVIALSSRVSNLFLGGM